MASSVSLSSLIMLPGHVQQLNNMNKLLEQQTKYYGAAVPEIEAQTARTKGLTAAEDFAQKQREQENELGLHYNALKAVQQFGPDSLEAQHAIGLDPVAKSHGVSGVARLSGADAQRWNVPEGTLMSLDAKGQPVYEDSVQYDANGRASVLPPGQAPDTGTGQGAPAGGPGGRRPLFYTPDVMNNFIRYMEAKGAPERLGGYETSNMPNVPNRDITLPAERAAIEANRAYAALLRAQGYSDKAASSDPFLVQLGNLGKSVFADQLGRGLTQEGQFIVMDALSSRQDVARRNPKAKPAELAQIALKEAWQRSLQRKAQGAQDPMAGDTAAALGMPAGQAPFEIPGAQGQPGVNAAGYTPGAPSYNVEEPPPGSGGGTGAPSGNLWEDVNARQQQEQEQQQQGTKSAQAAKAKRIGALRQRAYQLLLNEASRIQRQFPDWQRPQVLESALATVRAEMPSEGAYSMELWPQIEAYLRQAASSQASAGAPAPQSARGGVVATGTHVPPEARGTSATRAPGAARGGVAKVKMEKTMREWKAGTLHSGSKSGPIVTSQKQAVAIGLNQGRRAQRGFGMGVR